MRKKLFFFLPMEGCKRRCVYCDQNAITGSQLPDINAALELVRSVSSPVELCYFGGSFTCLPEHIQIQWLELVNCCPEGSAVRFSTHPQCITDETIQIFSKYPVSMVELGVSSLDDNVLAAANRGYTRDEVLSVISLLLGKNFEVCAQLMIGLPGQTPESSLNDIAILDMARKGRKMSLRIYPCLVLKNTPLEKLFYSGEFIPLEIGQAAEQAGELIYNALLRGYEICRVGLQETDSLSRSVVAGPHHPALGEMAFSHALARKLHAGSKYGEWELPRRYMSQMTGHGRLGIKALSSLSGLEMEIVEERLKFT
ncbi:MAG: radical SAM protein [Synergistaceae bacterium]|nr:radical SAM protein [Synergistaceae bacterium]